MSSCSRIWIQVVMDMTDFTKAHPQPSQTLASILESENSGLTRHDSEIQERKGGIPIERWVILSRKWLPLLFFILGISGSSDILKSQFKFFHDGLAMKLCLCTHWGMGWAQLPTRPSIINSNLSYKIWWQYFIWSFRRGIKNQLISHHCPFPGKGVRVLHSSILPIPYPQLGLEVNP